MTRHPLPAAGLLSAVAAAGLVLLLRSGGPPGRPLVVYTAASLRPVAEACAADFEAKTGRRVELRAGGSEYLLTQARQSATASPADVFLPADDSYLRDAASFGLAGPATPIGRMRAVVLAQYPVETWAALTAPNIRLALADPRLAAVGRLTRDHLITTGKWADFAGRVAVHTDTVTESATAVRAGGVDAAVVWDVVARQHPTLPASDLPELGGVTATVAAAVLYQSHEPDAAAAFVAFLADPAGGRPHFARAGFAVP